MKKYDVITVSDCWSTNNLRNRTKEIINRKAREGWEVVSVALGFNHWYVPTMTITLVTDGDYV